MSKTDAIQAAMQRYLTAGDEHRMADAHKAFEAYKRLCRHENETPSGVRQSLAYMR